MCKQLNTKETLLDLIKKIDDEDVLNSLLQLLTRILELNKNNP